MDKNKYNFLTFPCKNFSLRIDSETNVLHVFPSFTFSHGPHIPFSPKLASAYSLSCLPASTRTASRVCFLWLRTLRNTGLATPNAGMYHRLLEMGYAASSRTPHTSLRGSGYLI